MARVLEDNCLRAPEVTNAASDSTRTGVRARLQIAADLLLLVTANISLVAAGVGLSIVVNAVSGPEGLGIFNQAFAIYTLASAVGTLGLASGTLKFVAEGTVNHANLRDAFTSNVVLALCAGSATSAALLGFALFAPALFSSAAVASATAVFAVAVPFAVLNRILLATENGLGRIRTFSVLKTVRAIALLVGIATAAAVTRALTGLLASFIIVEGILCVTLLIYRRRLLTLRVSRDWLQRSLSFGLANASAEAVSYAADRIDVLVIGYFLPLREVGLYGFVVSCARALLLVPATFAQYLDPIVARHWPTGDRAAVLGSARQMQVSALVSMAALVGISGIAYEPVVIPLMGRAYENTLWMFLALSVGALVSASTIWSGGMLVMSGLPGANLIRISAGLTAGFTLLLALTWAFGLKGAVLAASLHFVVLSLVQHVFVKRYLAVSLLPVVR